MSNRFKNIKSFVLSRTFVYHISSIALVFFLSFFVLNKWLKAYTNHGETITVPDVRNMNVDEAIEFLSDKKLIIKVADSSVFDPKKGGNVIVEQDPLPNETVKEGRTIYLSVTKVLPPSVKMPNLVDVSLRQAEAILKSYGLKVGQLTYVPDLAKNAVLEQKYNGSNISSGTMIPQASIIDLVLGDGIGNTKVLVPDLFGLGYDEVSFVLKGSLLNLGAVIMDQTVKDTSRAKVFRQIPEYNDSTFMSQGEAVDIYMTESDYVMDQNKKQKIQDDEED
ncbi:MAG TPA: PASTA domain-containing protein [Bacteroidia bacterium]|nr:PASTA domain-containing protein [Bacteroidia bacterium]